jgi:hypothetical protein
MGQYGSNGCGTGAAIHRQEGLERPRKEFPEQLQLVEQPQFASAKIYDLFL